MADYADSQVLVSANWVEENRNDPSVSIIEIDETAEVYSEGHIPGAISWNWQTDLADKTRRDILGPSDLETLLSKCGISNTTTVVLYGDRGNWYAAWGFWQLKIYGHRDVRILNGGREKWIAEGRKLVRAVPKPEPTKYRSRTLNQELRAFLPHVKLAVKGSGFAIVDVRSADEFTGALVVPRGTPQIAQRKGHIPGAKSISWDQVCERDGTFKDPRELRELFESKGVTADKEVIVYSRIGERSSHTWFVLKHLLGYPVVKNYDGSWAEWGNLVGVAIETGQEKPPRFARAGVEAVRQR